MTREEAINKVRHMSLPKETMEILEALAPELVENEDERVRNSLLEFLDDVWHMGKDANFDRWGKADCADWITYLEKRKEREPIEMEVYEVGKGTTVCGQDYKCKKDYKAGNCRYIKDAIYHCGRDGYLTDQNGVSWSCTPEWFNEYIQSNTEWAEEEKTRFVSGQFLQCKLSFDGFKEGERYWLEYVGDDMYVGRSDNILNQRFHITPRQLYTLFSQQLEEKQKEQKSDSLIYDKDLDKAAREFYLSGGANSPIDSTGLVPIVRMAEFGATWMKERMEKEQKPVEGNKAKINGEPIPTEKQSVDIPLAKWGEEDEHRRKDAIYFLESAMKHYADTSEIEKTIDWLNSLRSQSKKELSMEKAIRWLDDTFYFLDNSSGRGRDCEITTHDFDSLEEMYDSFRKAVTVDSQSSWKPSEEEMEALKEAAEHSFYAGEGATLRILYNDLEKRYGTY